MKNEFKLLKTTDIHDFIDKLGHFRIEIFKEYPYLYDGDLEYEKEYLKTYSDSKSAFIIYKEEKGEVIAISTVIAMHEEIEEFKKPLENFNYDTSKMMYIGEIMIKKGYRGKGLGISLYKKTEKTIRENFPNYTQIVFCTVDRTDKQHLKPKEYSSSDYLWKKLGYKKLEQPIANLQWKDLEDNSETYKPFNYWIKDINS